MWLSLGPVGQQHGVEPRAIERVRVAAAAGRHLARLDAARAPARRARAARRASSTAGGSRGRPRRRRRRRRNRARSHPRCRRRPSRRRRATRALVERARLAVDPAAARRRRSTRPRPAIMPTFAVVSASSRPELHPRDRRGRGLDRGVAVLGPDPGVRLDALELGDDALVGRRGGDHLTDRRRVVEHEAERERSAPRSSSLAPAQPVLLGDREDELHPARGAGAAQRGAQRARPAPSPQPCCRRRGSSRRGCERPRRRARPRSAPAPGRCRGGRRTRPTPPPSPARGRSGCRRPPGPARPRRPRRPRPRARAARRAPSSATARSDPVGLGVSHRRTKRSSRRSSLMRPPTPRRPARPRRR